MHEIFGSDKIFGSEHICMKNLKRNQQVPFSFKPSLEDVVRCIAPLFLPIARLFLDVVSLI